MVRPSKEMTERELEVMHVYWEHGELTANEARDCLAESGVDRAYPTVANLVRILVDKGYLRPTNDQRPYRYEPIRSFAEVSSGFIGDLVKRVFQGSREQMLVHLFGRQESLSDKERELLRSILRQDRDASDDSSAKKKGAP
ncbi:MAG: BlaI/MecI/CopY family transcriptional regulator [bacterium]|nr:BlaI/MecI/CopY family transcriptional regulator [bacterium]